MSQRYREKDACADTGSNAKETEAAWHDARTDSGVRQGDDEKHFEQAPSWAKDKDKKEWGISLFPKGKEPKNEN